VAAVVIMMLVVLGADGEDAAPGTPPRHGGSSRR
jgi:hypothetical protein